MNESHMERCAILRNLTNLISPDGPLTITWLICHWQPLQIPYIWIIVKVTQAATKA